tara:strand:- start:4432 stop:5124 length:693 start_codon:yes stop_codon:yes gene_type:complete
MNILKKIYYSKYRKYSYAISNVDLIIDRIFSKINKGIYIDVGCNHPIKYNNTYLLYKRGWNGINIDSDAKSIKAFNQLRKDDFNVRTVISNSSKKIDYYFYHERSALNTVDKKLAKTRKIKPKKIIKLPALSLDEVIKKSPYRNKKINLLTIDIENHEYEALKKFQFKKYKIDMIVTECLNIGKKKLETQNQTLKFILNSKIYKLLKKNNYELVNWVNSDLVFVHVGSKI